MFRNLANNIKSDGGLSSLPLCSREKDGRIVEPVREAMDDTESRCF